ncbi:MAG: response regulator [Rhizobiales bacterium]|nr:response regulator [Hyphomicrobiales bacterium]
MKQKDTLRRTVLVVEDEFMIRADTADVLAEEGFEVIEAGDAEEALGVLAKRTDIGVLFTDVNLPAMDGLELAWIVCARWPEIQVIVTSGRTNPEEEEIPGLFIGKPYVPQAVAATVRNLIAG